MEAGSCSWPLPDLKHTRCWKEFGLFGLATGPRSARDATRRRERRRRAELKTGPSQLLRRACLLAAVKNQLLIGTKANTFSGIVQATALRDSKGPPGAPKLQQPGALSAERQTLHALFERAEPCLDLTGWSGECDFPDSVAMSYQVHHLLHIHVERAG
jgi:hypothetical protein